MWSEIVRYGLAYELTALQQCILDIAIKAYVSYKEGLTASKRVEKKKYLKALDALYNKQIDERTLRDEIAVMVRKGIPMAATSKEKGYYYADREEVIKAMNEDLSRMRSLNERVKGHKKALQFIDGQMSIDFSEVI